MPDIELDKHIMNSINATNDTILIKDLNFPKQLRETQGTQEL